jgi:hypothetical protein
MCVGGRGLSYSIVNYYNFNPPQMLQATAVTYHIYPLQSNTHGSHLLLPEPMDHDFATAGCSHSFTLPSGQIHQKWQLTECSHSLTRQYKVTGISKVLYNTLTNTFTFSGTIKMCNAIYHTQADQRRNTDFHPTFCLAATSHPVCHLPFPLIATVSTQSLSPLDYCVQDGRC